MIFEDKTIKIPSEILDYLKKKNELKGGTAILRIKLNDGRIFKKVVIGSKGEIDAIDLGSYPDVVEFKPDFKKEDIEAVMIETKWRTIFGFGKWITREQKNN